MLGYKIATHTTQYGNDIDGSYYMKGVKVLVVLDIPDDVKRTTPEMRYSKVPSGLTATELEEWAHDACRYKEYADSNKLFRDFKAFAQNLAMHVHTGDIPYFNSYIHIKKCRAAKAKVVKIIDLVNDTSYDCAVSDYDSNTIYQTGEIVTPDTYTDDYLNICAHGIHCFESPEDAILYFVKDLPPSDASLFLDRAEELLEKLRKRGDI